MASLNKVILIGNLGADPETRYMPSGDAVCNLRLATTEVWRDKTSGEKREQTEWHRVSLFGKVAETAGQYLRKGSQVYIEGRIQTRKWQDKDGQDRYSTEIRGDEMKMLGSRQGMGGGDAPSRGSDSGDFDAPQSRPAPAAPAPSAPRKPAPSSGGFGDFDDDIPF